MQFLPFIFTHTKMNPEIFYGKQTGVARTRVPPDESGHISLSDSGDSDEPKPADENSSNNAINMCSVRAFLLTYGHMIMNVTKNRGRPSSDVERV